jgi:hypothetical protein
MGGAVSSLTVPATVFVCTFGASMLGMVLHRRLPKSHLDGDSRDVVKLVLGLIATIAALVLGLLTASAQGTFSSQNSALRLMSANLIALDRDLAYYGPETTPIRRQLLQDISKAHDEIWSSDGLRPRYLDPSSMQEEAERLYAALQGLPGRTDAQQYARSQALQLAAAIQQTRLLMFEQLEGSIPAPFLAVLVFWLSVLFLGFGLFARGHATVLAAMLVGSLSVSTATFLILELNAPYGGIIQLSDEPIRNVIAELSRTR